MRYDELKQELRSSFLLGQATYLKIKNVVDALALLKHYKPGKKVSLKGGSGSGEDRLAFVSPSDTTDLVLFMQ